jgi:hypothetical protein
MRCADGLRTPLLMPRIDAREPLERVGCRFGTVEISALLASFMLLHVAKADGHATWLRWPLVLAPLLALPAVTLALAVFRGLFRRHHSDRPIAPAPASQPPASSVALGASSVSFLAFGILVTHQLASAESSDVPRPLISPIAWALALCPLAAALILRSNPRICAANCCPRLNPRAPGADGWQRLSSAEESSEESGHGGAGSPGDTAGGGQPMCDVSRHHSASAAGEDTSGGGRSRNAAVGGLARCQSDSGGGGFTFGRAASGHALSCARGAGLCSEPGADAFLEPGAALAASVASLASLVLYLASGGLLCAKMGGALQWGWQAIIAPAW